MPKAVKVKSGGVGGAAKKPAGAKRNKPYSMPEKIAEGTVLVDLAKREWCVGPSIGIGGFGEIYSASRAGENNYDYVIKCEPHANGPLFVEMHFYMRNSKLADIKSFKAERGLKALGMPHMLAAGSADVNGVKHRFLVLPRYGSDLLKYHVANGGRLPEATIYRIAIQMLDVYEFVHSRGSVHADLKAANILLGYGKGGNAQTYLVDYGLASHYTTTEFKPEPKKMHNGTIEYTSRDAHQGVATMRADLEILAYNLVHWLGVSLPWVRDKLLEAPVKVQKAKEEFMADVGAQLKKLFSEGVPVPVGDYFKYVAQMAYNDKPDYEKCRQIFATALRLMKIPNSGDLELSLKAGTNNNNNNGAPAATAKKPGKPSPKLNDSSLEIICASDDDDGDVVFDKKKTPIRKPLGRGALKTVAGVPTRTKAIIGAAVASPKSPNRAVRKSPKKRSSSSSASPSPAKRNRASPAQKTRISPAQKKPITLPGKTATSKRSPAAKKPTSNALGGTSTTSSSASPATRSTPIAAKANVNFSPALGRSVNTRSGKTVINDHLTPNARAGKTYEFNFELDVSMDANVIVNVKRKKKQKTPGQDANNTPSTSETAASSNGRNSARRAATTHTDSDDRDTPQTRIKVRKMVNEVDPDMGRSPRTPTVTVKKSRR